MAKNDFLTLLGLCRKAQRLAFGDETVADAVTFGKAKLILVTEDAGENIKRKVKGFSSKTKVLVIPCTKDELGHAIGKRTCSVCAILNKGFATSFISKLDEEVELTVERRTAIETEKETDETVTFKEKPITWSEFNRQFKDKETHHN